MDDQNKIDLKEVNKTKKSFKLPTIQLKNPFKKQKGPKRDDEGKFAATTGGGGLAKVKSLNWKRAAPIVVMVTLAGGYFVFQSFATSTNNQFITELYYNCFSRAPDPSGLSYWVGQLNNRTRSRAQVVEYFAARPGAHCRATTPAHSTTSTTQVNQTIQTQRSSYLELIKAADKNMEKEYKVITDNFMNAKKYHDEAYQKLVNTTAANQEHLNYINDRIGWISNLVKGSQAKQKNNENNYSIIMTSIAKYKQLGGNPTDVKKYGDRALAMKNAGATSLKLQQNFKTNAQGYYNQVAARRTTPPPSPWAGAPTSDCNLNSTGTWHKRVAPIEDYPSKNKYRCVHEGFPARTANITCPSGYHRLELPQKWVACRLNGL